jgi:hypothetical protein
VDEPEDGVNRRGRFKVVSGEYLQYKVMDGLTKAKEAYK